MFIVLLLSRFILVQSGTSLMLREEKKVSLFLNIMLTVVILYYMPFHPGFTVYILRANTHKSCQSSLLKDSFPLCPKLCNPCSELRPRNDNRIAPLLCQWLKNSNVSSLTKSRVNKSSIIKTILKIISLLLQDILWDFSQVNCSATPVAATWTLLTPCLLCWGWLLMTFHRSGVVSIFFSCCFIINASVFLE